MILSPITDAQNERSFLLEWLVDQLSFRWGGTDGAVLPESGAGCCLGTPLMFRITGSLMGNSKACCCFFFFFTFQTSIMFILASFYLYFSKVGDVQSLNVKTRLQSHNSHWLSTLRVHISRVLDEAGRGGDRDVSYEVIPYKTRDETLHIKFTVQSCKPEPGWDLSCFCLGMKVPLFQALWASFLLPGLPASRMLWALLHVHPVLCLAL